MSNLTARPSGVDGLTIHGQPSRGYELRCQPDWADHPVLVTSVRPFNNFRTVRDAKAAALRLADLLPWGDKEKLTAAVNAIGRFNLGVSIVERLTGKTREQLEDEHREQQETTRAEYDGTAARDGFNHSLAAGGHDVRWNKKGQRTWHGTCRNCGGSFRSSYQSMSNSYRRIYESGFGDTCEAAK